MPGSKEKFNENLVGQRNTQIASVSRTQKGAKCQSPKEHWSRFNRRGQCLLFRHGDMHLCVLYGL